MKTATDRRTLSVDVQASFFVNPPAEYEVQCFFISKDEMTKEQSIFNVETITTQAKVFSYRFASEALVGGTKSAIYIPLGGTFSGSTSSGENVSGTFSGAAKARSQTTGQKFDGWIVRIVSQGKVLRVDSNNPTLRGVAAQDPVPFDKAAEAVKVKK